MKALESAESDIAPTRNGRWGWFEGGMQRKTSLLIIEESRQIKTIGTAVKMRPQAAPEAKADFKTCSKLPLDWQLI